jgi:hypothetical protein
MKQSKLPLKDVLTILTALGFGFFCFLGTNFYTLGNVTKSITVAIIITILLFSTAFTAKLLKGTSVNFKPRFIWEVILLVVFTLLFVFFTYMPFSHFFTVLANQSVIEIKIKTSITQAENMFPAYEVYAEKRKASYYAKLKTVVTASLISPSTYTNYGFKSGIIPDDTQINKKMHNITFHLFPSNYTDPNTKEGIKEVANKWLLDAEKATVNWKPIGITNVVVDIETKSNEWASTLVKISKIREPGEKYMQTKDFDGKLPPPNDIKQHFTTVEKPSVTSLLIALLMWVLMMLSWFVTKRHTRFPGFKFLFGKSKSSNNTL